jgi:hypothetical protein
MLNYLCYERSLGFMPQIESTAVYQIIQFIGLLMLKGRNAHLGQDSEHRTKDRTIDKQIEELLNSGIRFH